MKTPNENVSRDSGLKHHQHVVKDVEGLFFFHRSPNAVFWLSLLSFNFYNLYWVYRQWRTIRDSTGEKLRPLARSIFQIFYIHLLMKHIVDAANEHKASPWKGSVTWMAVLYILSLFVGSAAGRMDVGSRNDELLSWALLFVTTILIAFITRAMQVAANYHNSEVLGPNCDYRGSYLGKIYPGEVIVPMVGGLILIFAAGVSVWSYNGNLYPQGTAAEISSAKATMDNLTQRYDACSNDLTARSNSVDANDEAAVNSYNQDLQACEDIRLQQNAAVDEYNRLAGFGTE